MRLLLSQAGFQYQRPGEPPVPAIHDVSLGIDADALTAIVGPTGSGKTTLLELMAGLLAPTTGTITRECPAVQVRTTPVGLVFQFPEQQIFEDRVDADVAFGPKNLGCPPEEQAERVRQALGAVGLEAGTFGPRNPFELSVGERRRTAMAGVLALQPAVLLMDEPTAGIDRRGVADIEQTVRRLHAAGHAVVLVSHDMNFVARLADRVVALAEGHVVFDGARRQFFDDDRMLQQLHLDVPDVIRWVRRLPRDQQADFQGVYGVEEALAILRNRPANGPPRSGHRRGPADG